METREYGCLCICVRKGIERREQPYQGKIGQADIQGNFLFQVQGAPTLLLMRDARNQDSRQQRNVQLSIRGSPARRLASIGQDEASHLTCGQPRPSVSKGIILATIIPGPHILITLQCGYIARLHRILIGSIWREVPVPPRASAAAA